MAEVSFFSDKARHFNSGEMTYEVLLNASSSFQKTSYSYHACYHGKTVLDGHFARLKERLNAIPVEK